MLCLGGGESVVEFFKDPPKIKPHWYWCCDRIATGLGIQRAHACEVFTRYAHMGDPRAVKHLQRGQIHDDTQLVVSLNWVIANPTMAANNWKRLQVHTFMDQPLSRGSGPLSAHWALTTGGAKRVYLLGMDCDGAYRDRQHVAWDHLKRLFPGRIYEVAGNKLGMFPRWKD